MDTDAYLGAAFEYNAGATKLQIDGNFTLNDNERNEFMANVTDVKVIIIFHLISLYMCNIFFQVYSDFILERQPTTFEEALEVYKSISDNFGSKSSSYSHASPKSVQLMPINLVSAFSLCEFLFPSISPSSVSLMRL